MAKKITRQLEEDHAAILNDPNYIVFCNRNKKAKIRWKFFKANA